ncbi:MAG: hypothetical protein RL736_515, partial [Pseudomonadota bacterium]
IKKEYRIETRRYDGCPAWVKSNDDFGF